MILAVIPAAGHSTRMGRPKLSLPLGDQTVLERVVSALKEGGVEHVVVVIGPHVSELEALAEAAGADVCPLFEPTADMRATVEHGLHWLETCYSPRVSDAFLLTPGDYPAFNAGVVRSLRAAFARDLSRSIVVPVHAGMRGHPVLIGWRHVAGIRAMPLDRGINAYLSDYQMEIAELPVGDAGVLCDLDTPEDYDRLWRSINGA
jgi:molybdenum cofactor cytidylyltransferase